MTLNLARPLKISHDYTWTRTVFLSICGIAEPIGLHRFAWKSGTISTGRRTMIRAMVLWCCLAGSAFGAEGDVWVDLNVGSKHFGGPAGYCYAGECGNLNEVNPGVGVSYEHTDHIELKAGYYENSYFKTTAYVAATASANYRAGGFSLSPGVTVGVATGYDETEVLALPAQPVAIASLKMQYGEARAVITYLPLRRVVGYGNDLVALQVGMRF